MADGSGLYQNILNSKYPDGRPSPKDMCIRYESAKTIRQLYEADWRLCAAYCMPRSYSQWNLQGPAGMFPDKQAQKRFAFDATGVRAVPKFAAILQRLATPDGQRWHRLQASNPALNKSYAVRVYFDALNDLLFKLRYNPRAAFVAAVGEMYTGLGVYGTSPLRLRWRPPSWNDRKGGFGYKSMTLRDTFILVDNDGQLDTVFVRMYMTARQFVQRFPGIVAPKNIAAELAKPVPSDTRFFEIVHVCYPRDDWDPEQLSAKRHPICSSYISVEDQDYIGPEGGYRSFPYLIPRTATEPGDVYGYSPAMQAMPALGSVNQMKRTILKQGQKAVDPTLLAYDDGVMSGKMGLTPGYVNYGAVNQQGVPLVHALPVGDFNVAENLLTDERADINDAFLVTLFQILIETPEMTATEVVERVAEKASLAAPTMGRLQNGFLGPDIEREIELIAENAPYMLPEMPPELQEAEGEYTIIYTSPLAKGLYAEEDAGFMRLVETALNVSTATQDPSAMDHFNFDVAIPELGDHMSVPARWMNDQDTIDSIRQGRQEQAAQQQAMAAAPAVTAAAANVVKMQKPNA